MPLINKPQPSKQLRSQNLRKNDAAKTLFTIILTTIIVGVVVYLLTVIYFVKNVSYVEQKIQKQYQQQLAELRQQTQQTAQTTIPSAQTKEFFADNQKQLEFHLRDVHELWGGRDVFVKGNGIALVHEILTQTRERGERWYRTELSVPEISNWVKAFVSQDFLNITTSDRQGVPDESQTVITVVNAHKQKHSIAKWAGDTNEQFNTLYNMFLEVEQQAKKQDPFYIGKRNHATTLTPHATNARFYAENGEIFYISDMLDLTFKYPARFGDVLIVGPDSTVYGATFFVGTFENMPTVEFGAITGDYPANEGFLNESFLNTQGFYFDGNTYYYRSVLNKSYPLPDESIEKLSNGKALLLTGPIENIGLQSGELGGLVNILAGAYTGMGFKNTDLEQFDETDFKALLESITRLGEVVSLNAASKGEEIDKLMDEANYCTVDADCVISYEFECPFGCYQLFHRNADLSEVRKRVEAYMSTFTGCDYGCPLLEGGAPLCVEGKCVMQ